MHLMYFIARCAPKFFSTAFVTREFFQLGISRDYSPVCIKNDWMPLFRKKLRRQYPLEVAIRYPNDHCVEDLSVRALNGYLNQCHPPVFNLAEVAIGRFTQMQGRSSS